MADRINDYGKPSDGVGQGRARQAGISPVFRPCRNGCMIHVRWRIRVYTCFIRRLVRSCASV